MRCTVNLALSACASKPVQMLYSAKNINAYLDCTQRLLALQRSLVMRLLPGKLEPASAVEAVESTSPSPW